METAEHSTQTSGDFEKIKEYLRRAIQTYRSNFVTLFLATLIAMLVFSFTAAILGGTLSTRIGFFAFFFGLILAAILGVVVGVLTGALLSLSRVALQASEKSDKEKQTDEEKKEESEESATATESLNPAVSLSHLKEFLTNSERRGALAKAGALLSIYSFLLISIVSILPLIGNFLAFLCQVFVIPGTTLFVLPAVCFGGLDGLTALSKNISYFRENLWFMLLLSILLAVAVCSGMILFFIGVFLTLPLLPLTQVVAYEDLKGELEQG